MKAKSFLLIALTLYSAGVCRANLEFSAYIQDGTDSWFLITDLEGKSSSGWIVIGQSFKGHSIVAFDPERELLAVTKGESILELRLRPSRVQDGVPISLDISAKLKAVREKLSNLRTRYTSKHPRVIQQVKILAELEGQLRK